MRSPRELAAELEELGRRSKVAALFLVSEGAVEFVSCPPAGRPGVLLEVECLIAAGWRPIALMAAIEVEGYIAVHFGLLPGISKEDCAAWQEVLIESTMDVARQHGLRAWLSDPQRS